MRSQYKPGSTALRLTALRAALVTFSIAIIATQLNHTSFAVTANLQPVELWWLIMAAGGLCLIAATIGTAWQSSGLIAALLLVGMCAQLALTQPVDFPFVRLRPWTNFGYLFFLSIAVQAAVTFIMLLWQGVIIDVIRSVRALSFLQVTLIAFLTFVFSVTIMGYIVRPDFAAYLTQLFVTSGLLLINAATCLLLALSLPSQNLNALAERITEKISLPGSPDQVRAFDRYVPRLAALFALVASGLFCFFALDRLPLYYDEAANIFQAKYFAQGLISVPVPPVEKPFVVSITHIVDDKWFSILPPGWPALLALGAVFGLNWLVSPILAAVSVMLAHAVFCRLSDRGTANLIAGLLICSPWFLATFASQMSHPPILTAALAAWLLLLLAKQNGSMLVGTLAGMCMGFLFLTRFLDGVYVGVLTGIWTLTFLTDRSRWPVVIGYGVGCLAIGGLIFPYNLSLTGDPLLTTHESYWTHLAHSNVMTFGFGENVGAGPEFWSRARDLYPGHGLTEALIHFQHNTHRINFDLFGWTMGSLIFLFSQLAWGRWTKSEIYMAILLAATIVTFSLFWFSGGFYFGARYWFLGLLPVIALSASGIVAVARKLERVNETNLASQRLGVVIVCLCVFSAFCFLSWRGVGVGDDTRTRNFPADYRELLRDNELDGSLVFVEEGPGGDFASAFMLNPPTLSGPDPIFARDLGAISNQAVAEAFPERPIYFVVGRSLGGDKAHIVEGPVRLDTLRQRWDNRPE